MSVAQTGSRSWHNDTVLPVTQTLAQDTIQIAARLPHWISENAKSTRAFLKRVGEVVPLAQPIQDIVIQELPREVHKKGDHRGEFDAKHLLAAAQQGHDIGLISEAGMPAIADPGSSVVRAAHELRLRVVPLVGPVSLMLALAASLMQPIKRGPVGHLRWRLLFTVSLTLLAVLNLARACLARDIPYLVDLADGWWRPASPMPNPTLAARVIAGALHLLPKKH